MAERVKSLMASRVVLGMVFAAAWLDGAPSAQPLSPCAATTAETSRACLTIARSSTSSVAERARAAETAGRGFFAADLNASAVEAFDLALSLEPPTVARLRGRAQAHLKNDAADFAQADLEAALALSADDAGLHADLAQALVADWFAPARALAELDTALRLDPKLTRARLARADLLDDLDREAEARAERTTALALDPTSAEAKAAMAEDFRRTGYRFKNAGETGSAVQAFEAAARLETQTFAVAELRRMASAPSEDDEAVAALDRLAQATPPSERAREALSDAFSSRMDARIKAKDIAGILRAGERAVAYGSYGSAQDLLALDDLRGRALVEKLARAPAAPAGPRRALANDLVTRSRTEPPAVALAMLRDAASLSPKNELVADAIGALALKDVDGADALLRTSAAGGSATAGDALLKLTVERAQHARTQKRYADAAALLIPVIKANIDSSAVQKEAIALFGATGDADVFAALGAAATSDATRYARARALIERGEVLTTQNKVDEALVAYQAAVAAFPETYDAAYGLRTLARDKNSDAARRALIDLAARYPKSDPLQSARKSAVDEPMFDAFEKLARARKTTEAFALADELLTLAPNTRRAGYVLDDLERLGDETTFKRFLAVHGRAPGVRSALVDRRMNTVGDLVAKGDRAAADALLVSTLREWPEQTEIARAIASRYARTGSATALDALKLHAKSTASNDVLVQAYEDRASRLTAQNDLAGARALINAALALAPTSPKVLAARGAILALSGDADASVRDFDAAIARSGDTDYFALRCVALDSSRRAAEIVRLCDAAIQRMPGVAASYLARGKALLQLDRASEAWRDFDRGLGASGGEAVYLVGRAEAARRLGRAREADADRALTLRLDPNAVARFAKSPLQLAAASAAAEDDE